MSAEEPAEPAAHQPGQEPEPAAQPQEPAAQVQPATQSPRKRSPEIVTVSRIVHYVAYGSPGGEYPPGACRAAIVTEVGGGYEPDVIGLAVVNPTGLFFRQGVVFDAEKRPGTWHWPERAAGFGSQAYPTKGVTAGS